MTHPTREEWMSLLYGEMTPETNSLLRAHLDACPECRTEMERWTRVSHQLNAWTLPPRAKQRSFAPVLKFAAAAALVAFAVVGGARMWALNSQLSQLRTELRREIANRDTMVAQITSQATKAATIEAQVLLTDFAKAFEEKRVEDQRLVLATLQQLETRQTQEYTGMRKDLETVAVLTEAGLRHAHNEIANIAYPVEPK